MRPRTCGRRVRDEAEARRCLEAVASSGLASGDWARRNGLDGRSRHAWELNLARRGTSPRRCASSSESHPGLVELFATPRVSAAVYLVHVGDVRVEVRADFNADVLRRLVHAVAAC